MKKPKKSKAFNYNLKSVLKVREIREKQEQEKFASAEKKFLEEKRKEQEMKDFQYKKYTDLRKVLEPGEKIQNFNQVLMRKTHLEVVKKQVEEQEEIRLKAEEKKEEQRQDLVTAVKNKKILEKDKEHKHHAWKKVMAKEEVKFLDDIGSIRFKRKET